MIKGVIPPINWYGEKEDKIVEGIFYMPPIAAMAVESSLHKAYIAEMAIEPTLEEFVTMHKINLVGIGIHMPEPSNQVFAKIGLTLLNPEIYTSEIVYNSETIDLDDLNPLSLRKGISKKDTLEWCAYKSLLEIDINADLNNVLKDLNKEVEEKKRQLPPKGRSQKSHDLILKMNKKRFS